MTNLMNVVIIHSLYFGIKNTFFYWDIGDCWGNWGGDTVLESIAIP